MFFFSLFYDQTNCWSYVINNPTVFGNMAEYIANEGFSYFGKIESPIENIININAIINPTILDSRTNNNLLSDQTIIYLNWLTGAVIIARSPILIPICSFYIPYVWHGNPYPKNGGLIMRNCVGPNLYAGDCGTYVDNEELESLESKTGTGSIDEPPLEPEPEKFVGHYQQLIDFCKLILDILMGTYN